jgi:hypothetical protein
MSSRKAKQGDRRVTSWSALVRLLYDIPITRHQRHRSDYIYRGVADERWDLRTSLIRLGGDYVHVERPLLRNFSKYAEPGSIPSDSLLVKLAVAQHHGLPTRVLDWTVSPRVALHFATFEEQHYDKDAAIWCINVVEAARLLPPALLDILRREYAVLFSVEMLEHIKTLDALEKLGKSGEFAFVLRATLAGRQDREPGSDSLRNLEFIDDTERVSEVSPQPVLQDHHPERTEVGDSRQAGSG